MWEGIQERKMGMRIKGRQMLVGALSVCALLMVFAGCGLAPAAPPTAQQILDRAKQSKMKDADMALSGTISTSISGISVTMTITGNGKIVFKPANAYHMTMNIAMSSSQINGTIVGDLIQVGDKQYSKTAVNIPGLPSNNSNLYTESAADQSSLLPDFGTNAKIVGEETIRGDKCWHLTTTEYVDAQGTPVTSSTSGATPVTADEWIRESDYYYVRAKLNTLPGLGLPVSDSSAGSSTAASNAGFTIDLSNYDTGATISPPPADQIQS